MTLGHLASWSAARQVVRGSFPKTMVEPANPAAWDEAYGRFQRLP
jgi:hypothetical protein